MSSEKPAQRIALFGGSFDPVHLGHVAIAEAAVEQAKLDRLIFLPCRQSPHKLDRAPTAPEHRQAMLELACADLGQVEVSAWELEQDEVSYSWMTASHFSGQHPDAQLFWVLGTDQWDAITRWAKPDTLAELLTFIVFPRGNEVASRHGFNHQTIDVKHPASSTEARARIARGEATDNLLAPEVADYIAEHGLYSG